MRLETFLHIYINKNRLKNIALNICVCLISTMITLAILELGCRIFFGKDTTIWQFGGYFKLDSELIYTLKSSYYEYIDDSLTRMSRATNSIGLRNEEITEKDISKKRIIILGDSLTFGYEVKMEESYPKQLERIFHDNHQNIEVINAGVPGYGTDQEYKIFITRLINLKPDYLILSLNDNDIGDNQNHPLYTIKNNMLFPLNAKKSWIYILGSIYIKTPKWLRKSYLYKTIIRHYENKDIFHLIPRFKNPDDGMFWSINKIILELKDLQSIGKNNSFELVVIRVPAYNELMEGKSIGFTNTDGYKYFTDSIKKENIAYYDSNPYFSKIPILKKLFLKDNLHLTKDGYKHLAEFTFKNIDDIVK